jgi:hypothetical protein
MTLLLHFIIDVTRNYLRIRQLNIVINITTVINDII